MTDQPEPCPCPFGPGEASEVVRWRVGRLVAAGLSPPDSFRLAHDPNIDLHELLELIDRGCPPELAVRITAPV